jgi:hypothetical protein
MSLFGAILALIFGILLATVWAVNIFVQIIGLILIAAGAVWLFRYLTGTRT